MPPWCGDCRRAKRWFDAHGIPYDSINIDRDTQAAAYVMQINGGMRSVPTIVFPDGSVLVEPGHRELAANCFPAGEQPGQGAEQRHRTLLARLLDPLPKTAERELTTKGARR
jgi:mycoredoxin